MNPATAARSGFTPEEIAVDASAILEGEPAATPVVLNDRVYPIRVRFPEASRSSLDQMMNTPLLSSTGKTATLGALASLSTESGQTEIRRENLQRFMQVTARLEGVGLGSGIAAVQKAVNSLHLPSSIRVEYGGTFQEQQKSFRDLLKVLFLALLLLFIVLLFEFRTFSAPAAILASALLSTFGALFALLITRTTFNIASFMGIIMVVGIVAKNGILLLDAEQRFRGLGMSAEEAMIQAGRRRLRPIAMTALATVAGMLASRLRFRRRLPNASAARHHRHRRPPQLHGPLPRLHSRHPLSLATHSHVVDINHTLHFILTMFNIVGSLLDAAPNEHACSVSHRSLPSPHQESEYPHHRARYLPDSFSGKCCVVLPGQSPAAR